MYLLLLILASVRALSNCDFIDEVQWTDISHGAQGYVVAANSKNDSVWIISSWNHSLGGKAIARYNPENL